MLNGWIPSKREKPKYYGTPMIMGDPSTQKSESWKYSSLAHKLKITHDEAERRDKRIREAYQNCKLYKGMQVELADPKDREKKKYVFAEVIGVARNLDEYGEVEWPKKHDTPYIVTISTDEGEVFCTASYFQPKKGVTGGSC
jgi:hypothetical protein